MSHPPAVLPLQQQDALSREILRQRLETILPIAMREAGLDMWLILCQEDDYDPIFRTLVPLRTWAPILQMLIFYDRGPELGIERLNLSMTDLGDLYQKVWSGRNFSEQWPLLAQIIAQRDPQRIGINTGSVQWAAGGLTANLHSQLRTALPAPYSDRLVSAEAACTRWLETLSPQELQFYPHLVRLTKWIIARCFSPAVLTPGVTTTDDLQWAFWQTSQDLGLEQSFIPFFNLVRRNALKAAWPVEDKVIRPGDLIHCDVGNRYLRLCSDLQEWAYVFEPGQTQPAPGLQNLFTQVARLQQAYRDAFLTGMSGDEILQAILSAARSQSIPGPRVYSHSLGYYLHEPGPLIGLPWEQQTNPGRGEVRMVPNSVFTMELSITTSVPEWDGQEVTFSCEQDVCFDGTACIPLAPLQTSFHRI